MAYICVLYCVFLLCYYKNVHKIDQSEDFSGWSVSEIVKKLLDSDVFCCYSYALSSLKENLNAKYYIINFNFWSLKYISWTYKG